MRKNISLIAAAAAVAMAAGASNAAITIHTSLASFNAATTGQATDGFTGFSITGTTADPITRVVGPYSYRADVSPVGLFFGAGTVANPWLSTNTATDSIIFDSFTGGVTAVGGNFFGSNIAGQFQLGDVLVTAVDSSGSVSQTIVGAQVGSFLGFVSNGALTSVTISAVQPAGGPLWPTVDNLVLAVPTPGAVALFGLAGVAGLRRRRA